MNPSNINTADYWDRVYRGEVESGPGLGEGSHRDYGPIHDAIVGLIPPGSRVLDLACGPGLLCRKIRLRVPGVRVLGVDFSEYAVRHNAERDRDLGIEYRQVDLRQGLDDLPGGFDVVTMCEVLEHLDQPEASVEAAMGRLREGGRFILTCPHENEIPDPEHVRAWGHDDLFHLLARYSDTVSFRHFPPPYFHPWMLAHLVKGPPPASP